MFRKFYELHAEVTIQPRFNLDDEIESIDVIIDNLPCSMHCEEFSMNDVSEPQIYCKRFENQRAVALKELTPGIYDEKGNLIRKTK